jgi:hypothetical protein
MRTIIFAVLLCVVSFAFAGSKISDIYGAWEVVSVLDSAPSVSKDSFYQSRALLHKKMCIAPEKLVIGNKTSENPDFEASDIDVFEYFYENFRLDPVNLRLPPKAVEILVNDGGKTGIYAFFIRNKNNIVFYKDDFFFLAKK